MADEEDRGLASVSSIVTAHWPSEWIELPREFLASTDAFFDWMALDPEQSFVRWGDGRFESRHRIVILQTVSLDLPFISGASVSLTGADALPQFDVSIANTRPQISIDQLDIVLHFPGDVVQAYRNEDGAWIKQGEGYDFVWSTGVDADLNGNVSFTVARPFGHAGSEAGGTPGGEGPPAQPPAMIADTGVLLTLRGVAIAAGGVPEGISLDYELPADFKGVLIDDVDIQYIKDGSSDFPPIGGEHLAIGPGGVSGDIGVGNSENAGDDLTEDQLGWSLHPSGPSPLPDYFYRVTFLGFTAVLQYFSISFLQSQPIASRVTGHLYIPLAEKWTKFESRIGGPDGDFLLDIGGAAGDGLISLENDWLEIRAEKIRYLVRDGRHYASIDGTVRPKVGDFDWPQFEVERLLVSSEGDIELEGGWIDLPEGKTLDFKGFKLEIDELGLGSVDAESGTGRDRWIGFSGKLTLIKGLPLSASVEGLRFIRRVSESGAVDFDIELEGVGISLKIKKVLGLKGDVAYAHVDASDGHGLSGDIFTGAVKLNLIALKTKIDGQLVVGRLATPDGRRVPAFYVTAGLKLRSPIPLGATGAGIYGFYGLFGAHMSPDRQITDGRPEPWYEWYKGRRDGDETTAYNVRTVKKWAPEPDHYGVGAGLLIKTQFDDGFTLSLRVLAAVVLPGPIVLLEGTANLLERTGDDPSDEGAFHALAVFDGLADTFQVNVDARYVLARVVEVSGGLEAFFDFNDSKLWHVYLGVQDPEQRRIRANVLEIINADSYLMIEPRGIEFGAQTGVDWRERFGPVRVSLLVTFAFDGDIWWSPTLYAGALQLEGDIGLKVFGIGFDLVLTLLLSGQAPDPYWIHGSAGIELSLPWPLPDLAVDVAFEWGHEGDPRPVTPLVKSVQMIHHKTTDFNLTLSDSEDADVLDRLRVPIDATPLAGFARPINLPGLPEAAPDQVGEWEFEYGLLNVVLSKKLPNGTWSERAALHPSGTFAPGESGDVGIRTLAFDAESLKPDRDAQEPELKLWRYELLERSTPLWRSALPDATPPCRVRDIEADICIDWRGVAEGVTYPAPFWRSTVRFIPRPQYLTPRLAAVPLRVSREMLQLFQPVVLRFPEPVRWFAVELWYPRARVPTLSAYLRGERRLLSTLDEAEVRRSASGGYYAVIYHTELGTGIDSLLLDPGPATMGTGNFADHSLVRTICYRTRRIAAYEDPPPHGPDEAGPEGPLASDLMLEPRSTYRVEVRTQSTTSKAGGSSDMSEYSPRHFYFRTGGAPGDNDDWPALLGKATDKLETYVSRTNPAHGASHAYCAYDLSVEFNEPYARDFYEQPFEFAVRDRNGANAAGAAEAGAPTSTWLTGFTPLFPEGLMSWLVARELDGCAVADAPVHMAPYLYATATALNPRRLHFCDIVQTIRGVRKVLLSTHFTTSRYGTFLEHIASGRADRTVEPAIGDTVNQTPRQLTVNTPAPRVDWTRDYREGYLDWTRRITEAQSSVEARHYVELAIRIGEVEKAFVQLHQSAEKRFGELESLLRPDGIDDTRRLQRLPQRLEIVQLRLLDAARSSLLIQSPEPLDWQRLSLQVNRVEPRAVFTLVAAVPVWNKDMTRAYVLAADEVWLRHGTYDLEFTFSGGGEDRPDIGVLTTNGTPVLERATLRVDLR